MDLPQQLKSAAPCTVICAAREESGSEFVGGVSAGTWSVAQIMAASTPARKASRTYTNQDVDRVNQGTGTVKYRGKTEHI